MDIRIQKLIVECNAGDPSDPLEFNDNAEQFVKQKVLPLLEDLLSELEEGFRDIELLAAELQVDLEGLLGEDILLNQISDDMLRSKLRQELLDKVLDKAQSNPANESIWDQFLFIVANGYAPWNFYQSKHSDFEQVLIKNKAAAKNNPQIKSAISQVVQRYSARYRVATMFSMEFIQEMLSAIGEDSEVAVAELLADLTVILPQQEGNETVVKKYLLLLLCGAKDSSERGIVNQALEILTPFLPGNVDGEALVNRLKTKLVGDIINGVVLKSSANAYTESFNKVHESQMNRDGKEKRPGSEYSLPGTDAEKFIAEQDPDKTEGILTGMKEDLNTVSNADVGKEDLKIATGEDNTNASGPDIEELKEVDRAVRKTEVEEGQNENSEYDRNTERKERIGKNDDEPAIQMLSDQAKAEPALAMEGDSAEKPLPERDGLNGLIKNYEYEPLNNSHWKKEGVYISNAGIILLAPYLSGYFGALGLVDGCHLKDKSKAVHLLQLLTGSGQTEEYNLALNKVLCGLEPEENIEALTDFEEKEITETKLLLEAVIGHWNVLKNTSVETLQTSFLQRAGKMHGKDEMIYLEVEKKTEDVLLSFVPWSFKMVKLPWMKYVLSVNWE